MKILVKNESEKKLIQRFLDAMHDLDGVEKLIELDNEDCSYDGFETILQGDDEMFLRQAIFEATIEVDSNVCSINVEHHNLQGSCAVCGGATDGTIDGDDITYDEWVDYHSEEGRKNWKCESCLNKTEV